jgi:nucleosome assembly protein 1-like 1
VGVEGLLTEQELSVRNHYLKAERFQDYWVKALKNCEFGLEITDKDEEILKHLERIDGHKSEDETKVSIKFYFSENQWFTNTEIIKEFLLEGDEIKKSYGDAIHWKEGKNITVKVVKKKQKNKKTGEKKVSTKEIKQESFFHFFDPIDLDDEDEDDNGEEDEANDENVEELDASTPM